MPVQDQRRHVQRRQHVAHVDVEEHLDDCFDAVRTHRGAPVAAEPLTRGRVLVRATAPTTSMSPPEYTTGMISSSEASTKPSADGPHGYPGASVARAMPPYSTSACARSGYVAANSDRHRHAFGDAHEHRAFGTDCVHHRSDVVHPFFERHRRDVAVGEAEAALVETDEPAERSQAAEEARDRRVLPLDVEVTREALDQHEIEVTLADHLVRDVHPAALPRIRPEVAASCCCLHTGANYSRIIMRTASRSRSRYGSPLTSTATRSTVPPVKA